MIWGVRGPLFHKLGIASGHDAFLVAFCLQHLAAHTASGTPLTPDEQVLRDSCCSLTADLPCYSPRFLYDKREWDAQQKSLTALAIKLFWRRPAVDLRLMLLGSSYIWGITGPGDGGYTVAFAEGPPPRYQVLRRVQDKGQPTFEWVEPRLPWPRILGRTFRHKWLFWRPAIYLYLILLSAGIAMLRSRSPAYGLMLLPLLLHNGCLVVLSPGEEFRYQFPVYLVSILYSGFLFFCVPRAAVGSTGSACPADALERSRSAGAMPSG